MSGALVEVGAKPTWVLSGFDVSEAIDVFRGRVIVVVVVVMEEGNRPLLYR